MADTFASGRATNPTPPHWEHFETMFVQMVPSYQSIYPAAQGVFLAIGDILLGHPWWGTWLEMGVFAAALCWMLQGWLAPKWALLGSLIALLQFAVTSYWMNSYWGGGASALGGALLVGAWPRVVRRPTRLVGVIIAIAIALLANSRPWEGFWLTAAVLSFIAVDLIGRRLNWRMFLPAGAVFLLLAAITGWYFWRVTGNPFRMPYQVAFDQYAAGGVFFWQPLRHPHYNNEFLERFYVSMATDIKNSYSSPTRIVLTTLGKLFTIAEFYVGPLVFCVLAMLPALLRNPRSRRLLIACLVVFAAMFVTSPLQVHYAAPLASVLVLVSTLSLRRFWLLKRKQWTIGLYLVPAMCIMMTASSVLAVQQSVQALRPGPREQILEQLLGSGSKHLVLVRYRPIHDVRGEEWVYNDADLEDSAVIWARDLGPEKNRQLLEAFPGRRVWIVEPDARPIQLEPYR